MDETKKGFIRWDNWPLWIAVTITLPVVVMILALTDPVAPHNSDPAPETQPTAVTTEIIGEWSTYDYLITDTRLTIFREGGQLSMEVQFDDGGSFENALVESKSSSGRRFDTTDGSGEFFVIDTRGNLEIWDVFGLMTTADKE